MVLQRFWIFGLFSIQKNSIFATPICVVILEINKQCVPLLYYIYNYAFQDNPEI